VPYLSASAVVIHHEEALYQVYAPLPFTFLHLHLQFYYRGSHINKTFALALWLRPGFVIDNNYRATLCVSAVFGVTAGDNRQTSLSAR